METANRRGASRRRGAAPGVAKQPEGPVTAPAQHKPETRPRSPTHENQNASTATPPDRRSRVHARASNDSVDHDPSRIPVPLVPMVGNTARTTLRTG